MSSLKIYISGPMAGYYDNNRRAFMDAKAYLETCSFEVLSPHEVVASADATWEDWMRLDIKLLMDCDAIYVLVGWERSRGATLELHIATQLGLEVVFEQRGQVAHFARLVSQNEPPAPLEDSNEESALSR